MQSPNQNTPYQNFKILKEVVAFPFNVWVFFLALLSLT